MPFADGGTGQLDGLHGGGIGWGGAAVAECGNETGVDRFADAPQRPRVVDVESLRG